VTHLRDVYLALAADLERRERIDWILVGGDVFPGPMPLECLVELLELELPIGFICGNGDREVLARMRGIETGTVPERFRPVIDWVATQLCQEHDAVIASWPATARLEIAGMVVLFCHATPTNDLEIVTPLTNEERLTRILEGVDANVVVVGHTHMQDDRRVGGIRWVNAGSVGMPYADAGGAYWALLGPEVELRCSRYDEAALGGYEYPQATRQEAAEYFESLVQ